MIDISTSPSSPSAGQERRSPVSVVAEAKELVQAVATTLPQRAVDEFTMGLVAAMVEVLNSPDRLEDEFPRSRKLRAYSELNGHSVKAVSRIA